MRSIWFAPRRWQYLLTSAEHTFGTYSLHSGGDLRMRTINKQACCCCPYG